MTDIDIIKNGLKNDKLAHACIVESVSPLALQAYADACVQAIAAHPLDVHVMSRSGKNSYLVEDARAFMDSLAMNPYGERKVGIVQNAEALPEIVQNKLLKTLEEPQPGTIIFLLCANREALLSTVKSRCVLIRLNDQEYGQTEASEESDASGAVIERAVDMLYDKSHFYEFRALLKDKDGISSQDIALAFLDALEETAGDSMIAALERGGKAIALTFDIDRIEAARSDILRGMGYKQALKRLYLELKQ